MSNDLITKKDLLLKYGISYGALYRWKRMGLIPEDWFIKRAVATGQETYFDRAAITERIETILSLKDTMSLEEIAARLGGEKATPPLPSPTLRLIWRLGEKNIPLDEIEGIFLVSPLGEAIDITGTITKIATEESKNE